MVGVLTMAVASVLFPAFGTGPTGTTYQFTVPKQGTMNASASYYCWVPEAVGTVRCIIVHHHGCGREGDGPLMMSDVQWLTLAKKWHAAFIGPSEPSNPDCSNWYTITRGSADSYLTALDTLARRCGHPEIKTVPWAIWGHSGGSLWMTAFATAYPDRIAVGVAQAGSVEMSNSPGALRIPILHCNGKTDAIYNTVPFVNGRAEGALWAHAVNPFPQMSSGGPADLPGQGHACHDVRMIAIPWMDYALASRLPDKAGDSVLKDMDTTSAWLGDTLTYAITSAATFTGNKLKACWFPNQTFATMWAEYMKNGTLKDSTPTPPAPYNMTGTYSNRQIVLKWDADADLETGIKTFIIYRNGALLQTIQFPNAPTTNFTTAKGFQRWDYGDQPDPTNPPAMTFTDATVSDTGTYRYQVSTVNWADVSGPKSEPIALSRGQVTGAKAISPPSAAAAVSRTETFLCGTIGTRALTLSPGMVDVYDIRGRYIKTLVIHREAHISVDDLSGVSSEKVLLVRNRIR
jgi:pimeloyl-ACP methyl ester carboxylesterase